jgi:hypothetical protein
VTLRLGDNGPQGRNIPLMTQPLESVLRWTRFGLPWYAKINQNTEGLHIQVERVSITKGLTRRLTTRN